mmetsp:Transcript_39532/g.123648  ORF Transcript_39532/g.123648 Transcript_39532/m.123648 type:complete len:227 (-) Transcript_39532:431-1111(-)
MAASKSCSDAALAISPPRRLSSAWCSSCALSFTAISYWPNSMSAPSVPPSPLSLGLGLGLGMGLGLGLGLGIGFGFGFRFPARISSRVGVAPMDATPRLAARPCSAAQRSSTAASAPRSSSARNASCAAAPMSRATSCMRCRPSMYAKSLAGTGRDVTTSAAVSSASTPPPSSAATTSSSFFHVSSTCGCVRVAMTRCRQRAPSAYCRAAPARSVLARCCMVSIEP